jgi:hypothetical protein
MLAMLAALGSKSAFHSCVFQHSATVDWRHATPTHVLAVSTVLVDHIENCIGRGRELGELGGLSAEPCGVAVPKLKDDTTRHSGTSFYITNVVSRHTSSIIILPRPSSLVSCALSPSIRHSLLSAFATTPKRSDQTPPSKRTTRKYSSDRSIRLNGCDKFPYCYGNLGCCTVLSRST